MPFCLNRQETIELIRKIQDNEYYEIAEYENTILDYILSLSLGHFHKKTKNGDLENHDMHDKIIVASAMSLECPIITMDEEIIKYVTDTKIICKTLT